MISYRNLFGRARVLAIAPIFGFLLVVGCAGSDAVSPEAESPTGTAPPDAPDTFPAVPPPPPPVDSPPADSPSVDTTGLVMEPLLPGSSYPFGPNNMRASLMTPMYKGTQLGITAPYFLSELRIARSKGGRFVQKMAGKRDQDIKNPDGTFSLAKWKALVNTFRGIDFNSYINDGTLMGHWLIDEPEFPRRWGGRAISQQTVEEMARYSKQLWPNMTTFVRGRPSWLAQAPITYTYLDAGWLQDFTFNRDVAAWVRAEAAAAQSKGLGMIVGINILDGGNGSSGIRGWLPNHWTMTAAEIRSAGTAMLNEPRACAFFLWTYLYQGAAYLARPDIKAAVTELWNKSKTHPRTSCRQ
jgi:hypothetical protein